MDINLLSTNLLIVLSLLASALATILVISVDKSWRELKYFNFKTVLLLSGAVTLSVAFQIAAVYFYPSEQLPALWLIVLPASFCLALIWPSWTSKKNWLKPVSVACVLSGALFSAIVLNNYYSFYPTLFSVFGNDTKNILATQNQGVVVKSQAASSTVESRLFDYNTAGTFKSLQIPGQLSGFRPRGELVYVPAIAKVVPEIKLPVIVLLPGTPGAPFNWLATGLKQTLNSFAKTHHGITPYVFVLDDTGSLTGDTECVNSPRGKLETYLTIDAPNYIKQHFNVDSSPQNWAIGGLSMGGTCSVMLALRHPDVYRSWLDFSGEIGPEIGSRAKTTAELFGGSATAWQEHQPLWLLANRNYKDLKMGGWFEIGSSDMPRLIKDNKMLYQKSAAAGIDATFKETAGQHTFETEGQGFKDSLSWISNRLGATN